MKKLWLLNLLILVVTISIMLTTLSGSPVQVTTDTANRVALLSENETGSFYMQIREGAQDAAENLTAQIDIETLEADDPEAQIAALSEDGVVAAILYAEDGVLAQRVLSSLRAQGIRSVTLGGEAGDCAVLSDGDAGAKAVAKAAREAGCLRALIPGNAEGTLYEAFTSAWTGETAVLEEPSDVREGDFIFALTAEDTREMMALREKGAFPAGVLLYGTDTGETRAADLESGFIEGMLLKRPYAIGYLALRLALEGGQDMKTASADVLLITPENMYLPENVDVIYPLIQ